MAIVYSVGKIVSTGAGMAIYPWKYGETDCLATFPAIVLGNDQRTITTQKKAYVIMPDTLAQIPFSPALYHSTRGSAQIDMLVLHYTDGPTLEDCVAIFRDPERRVSCHYIVGLDGAILQMVRDEDCAWHCGVSEWRGRERCNPWSLGIEIVNWGRLEKKKGSYFCWPEDFGTPYGGPPPVFARGDWWAPYPSGQIEQVVSLSGLLVERHQIPMDYIVRHSDIAPDRKIDPGPVFPWTELKTRMTEVIAGRW